MVRIVLVQPTSGAPDLLTLEAWQALSRGPVLIAPGEPLGERLREAGVVVEELSEAAPELLRTPAAPDRAVAGGSLRLLAHVHGHTEVPQGARAAADRIAERARRDGEAVFVVPSEIVTRAVMERALAGDVEVEVVIGRVPRGHRLLELVRVMAQLRGPQGCPWDREQTHQTLVRYLIDETYELLEAVERGTPEDIKEELGDLLLQVVFHAQMATDDGTFDIDDVADALVRKLVTRHPHVFGEIDVAGAEEVVENWDEIKRHEKGRASVVEGVPESLPALAYAQKLQRRSGGDPPDPAGALRDSMAALGEKPDEAALGEALFALTSLARKHGLDAETALRRAAKDFRERLTRLERTAAERGVALSDLRAEEIDGLWR
jgi:uncharacterized protein YabN with tetrapyrrole methylase and pyrophosphatase domain